MAKKPNYQFDRFERDRQKAAKKAERLAAKQAKSAEKRGDTDSPDQAVALGNTPGDSSADAPITTPPDISSD